MSPSWCKRYIGPAGREERDVAVKLSTFSQRIEALGNLRLVVTNGAAVAEWQGPISGVSLGARSWNFGSADHAREFHLYTDRAKSIRLSFGEHPRFKRRLGELTVLDADGEPAMMLFYIPDGDSAERDAAMAAIVAEYGEHVEISPEG
jgi:hypothetical protein